MQVVLGLPEPRAFSSLPRLRLVQAGIQRVHREKSVQPSRIRLPITPTILRNMHRALSEGNIVTDTKMLWAASVMCFFGFFRSGEITVPNLSSFDDNKHLAWGDVAIDDPSNPQVLQVRLKVSKTDQLGKGVEVYLGKIDCSICPVAGVLDYMAARGTEKGPFFRFKNGQPLTKSKFTAKVREVLTTIGLPQEHFAGHSFRIGAATAAAQAGIEDSTIRIMGRWNSAAFLTYIRTPRAQLAKFSSALTQC